VAFGSGRANATPIQAGGGAVIRRRHGEAEANVRSGGGIRWLVGLATLAVAVPLALWWTGGSAASRAARVGPAALGDGAIVTYHYAEGRELQPGYRSWTFTVDHRRVAVQVSDGVRLVAMRDVAVPPHVWRQLARGAADVTALRPVRRAECRGTTTRLVRIVDRGDVLIDRKFDDCPRNRAAVRTLDAYAAPLSALAPDLAPPAGTG
jgi:hypothetical protein